MEKYTCLVFVFMQYDFGKRRDPLHFIDTGDTNLIRNTLNHKPKLCILTYDDPTVSFLECSIYFTVRDSHSFVEVSIQFAWDCKEFSPWNSETFLNTSVFAFRELYARCSNQSAFENVILKDRKILQSQVQQMHVSLRSKDIINDGKTQFCEGLSLSRLFEFIWYLQIKLELFPLQRDCHFLQLLKCGGIVFCNSCALLPDFRKRYTSKRSCWKDNVHRVSHHTEWFFFIWTFAKVSFCKM